MKSLGLALGGGGLKGLAHIGVLQVLEDNHIKPKFLSGTSAGSIIAALYASGLSPYQIETEISKLTPSDYIDYNLLGGMKYLLKMIMPVFKYTLNGIVVGNKIEKIIYKLTKGRHLNEVEMPLAIVACDIDSGRKIIFTNMDELTENKETAIVRDALLSEAVRASISIPVTFQPKKFQGMQMVDGGLKDIVPVMESKYMGADYVLVVNLGTETYLSKVDGIPEIISRTLSIMTYQTSDAEEDFFADMLIYPRVPDVGLTDLKNAPQIIRAGRRAMRDNIDKLKSELLDGQG